MSAAGTATPPRAARRLTRAVKQQAEEDAALLQQAEAITETRAAERKAQKTKPNPSASRADPRDSAEFNGEDGKPLTRKSKRDGGGNPYDIPANLRKPGWDYEYKTIRVLAQQVDPADMVDVHEGGWRPVPASQMKSLVPPGWDKPHIERGGQVLMMRPLHLTEEARKENIQVAEEQRYDKLKGALAGPQELGKVARRVTETLDLHGSVGNVEKR